MNQQQSEENKQPGQIPPEESKQSIMSLNNKDIWDHKMDESYYKHFETVESCKGRFPDKVSLLISSITVR